MDELARNWIQRAENDLKTAKDEFNTDEPATDTVCFHAQQCAEKYLKAYLTFQQKHFKKTHNISKLIELCKEIEADFDTLYQQNADRLTQYAVELRYPDDFYMPSANEAKECIEIAEVVRTFIKERLKSVGFNETPPP